MKKIIVIKAGDTFPHMVAKYGGFDKWVADRLHVDNSLIKIIDVEKGEELPDPADTVGAVMTGSHSMVTEGLSWSVKTAEWIKKAVQANTPFLGICYGHQLMADALGGEAGWHPDGMEIGTAEIYLNENAKSDPLFKDLPMSFKAHTVHSQTALKLPEGAVALAYNNHEPHHAFRIGAHAWGVQFHPEFSGDVMRDYIDMYAEKVTDPDGKLIEVTETAAAASILRRFSDYCFRR